MAGEAWIEEARGSWMPGLISALAPAEAAELGSPKPGEGPVAFCIRVARGSRRAKARQLALCTLFPAARDRLEGVVELAVDRLFNDSGKFVRYEACRMLALACDPATLKPLHEAWERKFDVPWEGIGDAYRAVEQGDRDAFYNRPGWPGHQSWIVQDERTDFKNGGYIVEGSLAYGTKVRGSDAEDKA